MRKNISYEVIAEFSYVLIMSKEHKLANKDDIRFPDLKPFTEIAHADPFVPSMPIAAVRREELPNDCDRHIFVFERASQFELLQKHRYFYVGISPVGRNAQ